MSAPEEHDRHDPNGDDMQKSLDALRRDPASVPALEAFFRSASAFLQSRGDKPPVQDVTDAGTSDAERFLAAVQAWAVRPRDAVLGVAAVEASAQLNLRDSTVWLGERAMLAAANQKRPRATLFLRLANAFTRVGDSRHATFAVDISKRLSPPDRPPPPSGAAVPRNPRNPSLS